MQRRLFLSGAALAASSLVGCNLAAPWSSRQGFGAEVRHPGMVAGHRFRDALSDASSAPVVATTEAVIVGSGVAALSCAWQLQRSGFNRFVMLDGPAPGGNADHGQHAFTSYPRGAHYLPLPGPSCLHVRELLQDAGVLLSGLHDRAPGYDERHVVHASAERVFHRGEWHAGLVPPMDAGSEQERQWKAVLREFARLSSLKQANGAAVFQVPVVQGGLAGHAESMALDAMTFASWLERQGVTDPTLLWYFDYAMRDEFGVDASLASAWAGVHYFCSRHGHGKNVDDGAVLTWPNGLGYLAQFMGSKVASSQRLAATVIAVSELSHGKGSRVVFVNGQGAVQAIEARHVVVATPLFVARRIAPHLFDDVKDAPGQAMSPWVVANFFLQRFPKEKPGEVLSWDNVVSGSSSLGYVVATHQQIRTALPEGTVFTAYHALGSADNRSTRKHLAQASAKDLVAMTTADLDTVYDGWRRHCVGAEITVHGHAMAVPAPGFLRDPVRKRALDVNEARVGVRFAHSDLSGYSVFEEASFHGVQAANAILRR